MIGVAQAADADAGAAAEMTRLSSSRLGVDASLVTAAQLARLGETNGARHGCVLVVEEEESGGGAVLGAGFNHRVADAQGAAGN